MKDRSWNQRRPSVVINDNELDRRTTAPDRNEPVEKPILVLTVAGDPERILHLEALFPQFSNH